MKPTIPDHTVEPSDGHFVVKVGTHTAGTISEDKEHPGLWFVIDEQGAFMGRQMSKERAAEFLAAWFVADEDS
ncbi:hypothetical protein HNR01_001801 [Methylorubrum rhodesianum]|uniref:hypothetical protein n=1 Tax=Methylorubrum rhodesianum TaxID=29427 RepID=UPI00160B55D7|nr:hypothetical protein [Methylorubrum rhodesianum]MBB5762181.1 hypothetical protein [Methylorubrum rhodesianum]